MYLKAAKCFASKEIRLGSFCVNFHVQLTKDPCQERLIYIFSLERRKICTQRLCKTYGKILQGKSTTATREKGFIVKLWLLLFQLIYMQNRKLRKALSILLFLLNSTIYRNCRRVCIFDGIYRRDFFFTCFLIETAKISFVSYNLMSC